VKILKKSLSFAVCSIALASLSGETLWIAAQGGVYRSELDETTGALTPPELSCAFRSGSFLAIHPKLEILYATFRSQDGSGYASLTPRSEGEGLELQSVQLVPKEYGSPSHLAVSGDGRWLAGAHWGGKSNFVFELQSDGSVAKANRRLPQEGKGPGRSQNQSRPHWIGFTKNDSLIHSVDLGSDEIWTYSMEGGLTSIELKHKVKLPVGTGPRHLAFHPDFEYAYVSGELNLEVNSFHYDQDSGRFSPVQYLPTVEAPAPTGLTTLSEIQAHQNGRFVYSAVRGRDLIVVYKVDPPRGELTMIERQDTNVNWPRHFTISHSGKWLIVAGQKSHDIRVFSINTKTGELEPTDARIELQNPVCIRAWNRM